MAKIKNKKEKLQKAAKPQHRDSKGNIFPLAEGDRGGQSPPNKVVRQAERSLTDGSVHVTVKPNLVEVTPIGLTDTCIGRSAKRSYARFAAYLGELRPPLAHPLPKGCEPSGLPLLAAAPLFYFSFLVFFICPQIQPYDKPSTLSSVNT